MIDKSAMASPSTYGGSTDFGSSWGVESQDLSGCISEADKVLYSIEGILDQMRPENIYVLKGQIINAAITSGDILEGVTRLIFERAVSETTFCPMYAELCSIISRELPSIPSGISFRRTLLDLCQHTFEGYTGLRDEINKMTDLNQESQRLVMERMAKFRAMGNIRFIGEIFKKNMLTERIVHLCIQELLSVEKKVAPTEECLELVCELLKIVGKKLEQNLRLRVHIIIDSYLAKMKKIISDQNLPSRVRLMVRDVVHLRANNWILENEEVKVKILDMYSPNVSRSVWDDGNKAGFTDEFFEWSYPVRPELFDMCNNVEDDYDSDYIDQGQGEDLADDDHERDDCHMNVGSNQDGDYTKDEVVLEAVTFEPIRQDTTWLVGDPASVGEWRSIVDKIGTLALNGGEDIRDKITEIVGRHMDVFGSFAELSLQYQAERHGRKELEAQILDYSQRVQTLQNEADKASPPADWWVIYQEEKRRVAKVEEQYMIERERVHELTTQLVEAERQFGHYWIKYQILSSQSTSTRGESSGNHMDGTTTRGESSTIHMDSNSRRVESSGIHMDISRGSRRTRQD